MTYARSERVSDMLRKVKWGVIGTAGIAEGCTIPGMQQAKNVSLYAIAGRSISKAEQFKDKFGFKKAYGSYEELLSDKKIEAVYIPLPNNMHYEWVMKSIEAGKHVLCEKPLAPTARECEELYAKAKEKGVLLMEAFAYLHSPYVEALKKDVESGIIGDVRYIEAAFLTSDYNKKNIRMNKDTFGGATYDLGCYCTSLILSIMGKEPEKITAIAEMNSDGIDMLSTGILKYPNDVRATFRAGMVLETDMERRMDRVYIHGSKGCIKSDVEFNQEGRLSYKIYINGGAVKGEDHKFRAPQNYRLETEQFSRCIRGEEKPFVTEEFSIMNARVLDRILNEIGY